MTMLLALLTKDLRRAARNPLPWLVNLAIPLVIVGIIGLVFGGGGAAGPGRIRFAFVDEDGSPLVRLLRGMLNQGEAGKHLAPEFLERAPALARLEAGRLSAVVILPENFTRDYLAGRPARVELIKNPAESLHPTMIEEGLGALVTALNALSRVLGPDRAAWQEVFDQGGFARIGGAFDRSSRRLEDAKGYFFPPLVVYEKETRADPAAKRGPSSNLFGYMLAGMAAMFLLFLARNGMADLSREMQLRTLDRYHTFRAGLLPFLAGKILFVVTMLVVCALVLFGGGGLIFGVTWGHPLALAALALAYALFAAGLLALLTALFPDDRRGGAISTLVTMAIALAGGCAFPPEMLPPAFRDHVMTLMPTAWFVQAARGLDNGAAAFGDWGPGLLELLVLAAGLLGVALWLLRRRLEKGVRA